MPVAITGIGCLSAIGLNFSETVERLFQTPIKPTIPTHFKADHSSSYPVFEIKRPFMPSNQSKFNALSRTTQLALTAADEAISHAQLDPKQLANKRVGVCIGTTVGSAMNDEAFYRTLRMGQHPPMKPIQRFLAGNPAAAIARAYDLNGPCQTVVNACSSGTDAIGIGAGWIQSDLCDVVIAGGADEVCRVTYNGFISLMITDDTPCKPFDRHRKGLNLGKGAAVLVLESNMGHQKVQASICGYGIANDAHHLTAPHPEGRGLKHALIEAFKAARINKDEIAFVHAHGTGTPDNDRVESTVISEQFQRTLFLYQRDDGSYAGSGRCIRRSLYNRLSKARSNTRQRRIS
jgi:3-oxoacyl-(acyl-carrier-protein) synthase